MTRRGRGARNGPRGLRTHSTENSRLSTPNRNGNKYNLTSGLGGRKLPNNKQPRALIAATPKPSNNEGNKEETTATITNEEVKAEPIILTMNQNQQRPTGQKKHGKGKNKQQTPAYTLKKLGANETDDNGEPMIGPKLPPEFEVNSLKTNTNIDSFLLFSFRKNLNKNIHSLHRIWTIQKMWRCLMI